MQHSYLSNDTWAQAIIRQLIKNGVSYFCIAPGSRSTPLVLAVARESEAKSFVHFDERGIAFHALGFAKATSNPVAVIVTSGTALGNLYPAVMEAYHAQVPLILLTADRTFEDRNASSNQTTDQVKFFGTFTKWQIDLPPPSKELDLSYVHSMLNHAVYMSRFPPQGPIQINCMFRKPLTEDQPVVTYKRRMPSHLIGRLQIAEQKIGEIKELITSSKRGLILIGQLSCSKELEEIYRLGNDLQWPILADITTSPFPKTATQLSHHDLLFTHFTTLPPDCVLHFGKALLSLSVTDFLTRTPPEYYIHIDEDPVHVAPGHLVTLKVASAISSFSQHLRKLLPHSPTPSPYFLSLQRLDELCSQVIQNSFSKDASLTEAACCYHLIPYLAKCKDTPILFIGNSMPIRNAEHFFSRNYPLTLFTNRGLSGIDGNIATAIGIAKAREKPIIALLGDQTFLHDLNSLAQIKELTTPIIFLVFNNQGGAIFSHLPVAKKAAESVIKRYFHAAHSYQFSDIASQFNMSYESISNLDQLHDGYSKLTGKKTSSLIEIQTDIKSDLLFTQKLHEALKALSKEQQEDAELCGK